ncbi:MAG: rRNA maturation RNase YbeY [Bacteroidetes bacterium]|jgi:rRNA maturation RNase YbeY|nr:rRNA maturation RNase YbeY [Bacteroidota bacterium]
MSIEFHGSDGFGFDNEAIRSVIYQIFKDFDIPVGRIVFVLMSDEELLQINTVYLKHNYYTDVITFPISLAPTLEAEIYVSRDRVAENGGNNPTEEMYRVLIHGCLHLCGYNDSTIEERALMTDLENRYLLLVPRGTIKD